MARTKVLRERAPEEGEDSFDTNDDAGMQPAVSMKGADYGNKKVQTFMKHQDYMLKKRIKEHNLNNLIVGTQDELNKEFENDDMQVDALDDRVEKQIERVINEEMTLVKKGSTVYQQREGDDLRRVRDSFNNLVKRQKQLALEYD